MSTNGKGRLRVTPWMSPVILGDVVCVWEVGGRSNLFVCDQALWRATRIKRPAKVPRRLRVWVQRNSTGVLSTRERGVVGSVGWVWITSDQEEFLSAAGINRGDRFDCWVEWEAD